MPPKGKIVHLIGGPFDGMEYELVSEIRPKRIHVDEGRKNHVAQYLFETTDTYGYDGIWRFDPKHPGDKDGPFGDAPHFDRVES